MVKKLVIIGDSFCHGIGTASVFKDNKNLKYAFGKFVAAHLNFDYVNLAEPGSSVLRAVELGYNYVEKHLDEIGLLIAGWTHPSRVGFYSENSMLQILPKYTLLGNSADADVFIKYNNNVKFITDKHHQQHLDLLPILHRIFIEEDFLDSQINVSKVVANSFKSHLTLNKINYVDFNVFGNPLIPARCPLTFNDVMIADRHPTTDEQEKFASLLINFLDNYVEMRSN